VSLLPRLKERRIVQWALAYLAAAWLALQVLDFLRENFGWTETTVRSATVLLAAGFVIVCVVAWYHGERGRQRVSAAESALVLAVLTGAAAGLALVQRAAPSGRAAAAGAHSDPAPAAPADPNSIAVLPFANQSADLDNEYFSLGITDDIITQLAQIRTLKVISRTSVMRYRDPTARSLPEIGRELGAAFVLEGGVRRSGERVRISAQLIDARTDTHLWARAYDRELTVAGIFEIQTEIARAISGALAATLTPEDQARIAVEPTLSLEAYDLYSRARYLQNLRTVESRLQAIELYRQAIAVDPDFALAYAGLAGTYVALLVRGSLPRDEAVAQARPAAERALQLNPELPEAHAAHGFLLERGEGNYLEARAAYRRALELNPGYAAAHAGLGQVALNLGDLEEARRELRRSVELDPLALQYRAMLAMVAELSRDYAAAEDQALRLLELDPDLPYGHYLLGYALSDQGRHEEAIAAMARASELDPGDLDVQAGRAFMYARAGDRKRALALADTVERQGGPLKELALVFGQLGDVDRAFEYLDRAYAVSPGELSLLRLDPSADPLRADPRFEALIDRLDRP